MTRFFFLLFLIIGLLQTSSVEAQARNASGLWVGVDVGGGWARIGCDLCIAKRELGYMGGVSFGGTVRPGFLVGAKLSGWSYDEGEASQTMGSLTGLLTMYPRLSVSGVFVQGGASVHYLKVTEDDDDVNATTFGFDVGVGYEFDVVPGWALVNSLTVSAGSFGSLKAGDVTLFEGVSNTILRFGVGIKRH